MDCRKVRTRAGKIRLHDVHRTSLALCAVILAAPTITLAMVPLERIALTGDAAPGGPPGALFQEFGDSKINSDGKVAFIAAMQPGVAGVTEDESLGTWTNASGPLIALTAGDPPAPGVPGARFEILWSGVQFSDAGKVFQEFQMESGVGGVTADNDIGGWTFNSGGSQLVYREGASLPGLAPEAQLFFGFVRTNALGELVLAGRFRTGFGGITSSNDAGLWSTTGGILTKQLQKGDQVAGAPAGAVFDSFGPASINANGVIASAGALRTGVGGVTENNEEIVYSNRSGAFMIDYREGGVATGTAVFDFFYGVRLNNSDRLAIDAELKRNIGGVTSSNGRGIWVETAAGLRQVVRTDDPMPGVAGRRFRGFSNLAFNDSGRVAFAASSSSPATFDTIFSEGISGTLTLVARANTPAPGTSAGVLFDFDHLDFTGIPKLMMNNSGQIAFMSGLSGTGVTTSNNMGIWAQDTSGTLKLVVRKGTAIEVGPGDLRVVQRFNLGGLNDSGQLVFDTLFTDGASGVFVADLAAQLAGDFNGDGSVDAADYVTWRKGLGSMYTMEDYATWRAHFGQSAGTAATSLVQGSLSVDDSAVPEPECVWWLVAVAAFRLVRGGRRWS